MSSTVQATYCIAARIQAALATHWASTVLADTDVLSRICVDLITAQHTGAKVGKKILLPHLAHNAALEIKAAQAAQCPLNFAAISTIHPHIPYPNWALTPPFSGDLGEDLWWEPADDALLSPLHPMKEDIKLISPLHILSDIGPNTDTQLGPSHPKLTPSTRDILA
ncbi:hypothetical protein EW146_g6931 [Bondarzewia mesenterica]|uniref:Uncharacterized protein n=1 Tax=Bondarzewia mesenterica TaxID=1095465 RepID=A0A4S4LMV1_9AGAM|nr:hypothetical protein EW146_g6931 [Bondarzewia mesenterica]